MTFINYYYLAVALAGLGLLFIIVRQAKSKTLENLAGEIRTLPAEAMIIRPEKGSFRGSSARFGRLKCDGIIYLTKSQLVFHRYFGKAIKIDLAEIKDISEAKWFNGEYRSGQPHLVLHLADETRVGFFVIDNERWKASLKKLARL